MLQFVERSGSRRESRAAASRIFFLFGAVLFVVWCRRLRKSHRDRRVWLVNRMYKALADTH